MLRLGIVQPALVPGRMCGGCRFLSFSLHGTELGSGGKHDTHPESSLLGQNPVQSAHVVGMTGGQLTGFHEHTDRCFSHIRSLE